MPGDAITLKGFAWQIHFPPEELEALCNRIREEYKTWYKPKSGGGERKITTCFGKLRVVQQRILDVYLRDITWPEYIYGIGEGRGAIKNAKAHQGKHHHFLTDVLDFYPRTESKIVHDVFTDLFGFTPPAARIATRLTTLHGGLPQGTHPSTHLAYLAFRKIDRELHKYADRHGITYTRYGDDLSFSAPHSFQSKVDDIMDIVEGSDTRYNLHQGDKTYYKQGPVEITGVQVLNNKIEVPDRFRRKLARLNPSSAKWESLKRQIDRIEQL
jgi:hypothetical protein